MTADPFRAALDALLERRRAIDAAIEVMQRLVGETIAAPAASNGAPRESKRATRDTKGTAGETRPTSASLGDRGSAILAALDGEVLTGSEILGRLPKQLQVNKAGLRYEMAKLVKSGRVIARGATHTRTYTAR